MSYKYNVLTGVTKQRLVSIKNKVIGATAVIGIVGAMGAPVLAANSGYCVASAKGCESAAAAGAQCGTGAGSGAFGALGKYNNEAGGANGYQTGINNSAVCGNRP